MENECLEPQELQELFELRNVASYFTSLVETLEQLQYNLKTVRGYGKRHIKTQTPAGRRVE